MIEIILTSSFLILFLIVIRKLLRGRISPTVQYALWLLVAARLLIPGTLFTAPVSLLGSADSLLSTIEEFLSPKVDLPAISDTHVSAAPGNIAPDTVIDYGDTVITYSPPQSTAPVTVQTTNWLAEIWKLGIFLVGSALLISNLSFYVNLRKKRRLLSVPELPRPYPIRVYSVPELTSPCLFGLIRPAIYLNEETLTAAGSEYILTHEETHYRHGDHIWSILRCVCLAAHWYNPLVWWAAALSRRDCELSCDAGVIRRLGEENRIFYGEILLRMVVPGRHPAQLLRTATTMSGEKKTMTERITLIVKQPKMLKITLAAVILMACGAAVFFFGGVAEKTPDSSDEHLTADTLNTNENTIGNDAVPALTEADAIELYHQAREIWSWFEFGTLPTTDTTLRTENGTMLQVSGFDSLEALRRHLETYFSSNWAAHLLTDYTLFQESDGKLFVLPAERGSNIYAGKETVTAFISNAVSYDCHIYAATEVLDFYEPDTVLYQKRHDWYILWNGNENYVFTSFGPYDDVDPQKYYNVLTILDHYNRGNTITTWYPVLANLDWNALYATKDLWPENFDLGMYIIESVSQYITEYGSEMTGSQYNHILSATEGLDGAYSEGFGYEVYRLYENNPGLFAYTVLNVLSSDYQKRALDLFRYEEVMRGIREVPMDRETSYNFLLDMLSDSVSATPASMTFDQPGQKEQLLFVNAHGIYAASYSSSDPDVATVDEDGFVTAVGPGSATITLHYEGAAGQKDLTCAVSCEWEDSPVSEEPTRYNGMDRGEIVLEWQRSFFSLVNVTPACPGGELYFDDMTDGALKESILWRLEESAREYLGDEFDSIQLLEDIVTPEDQCYPWEITVTYQVIAKRTNTFPSGETYTLTQDSEPLTTTFQAAGNHYVMNMIRFEGMDLMDDCQLPDTNLTLQEPWTLEHIWEDIQTRTNAHLQTVEGRSGLTVTAVVLEKELVIPKNIHPGDTINVSYNLYLQGASSYEPTSLGVFTVIYTFQ